MQCHFHVNRNSSGHILVTVEVQEIQNLPDFFTGGVRVSIWFEGQPSSCVTSDAFSVQGGTSIINFQQTFCFGSLTNDLKRYFSSDVLYLRLDGYI
ncbi:unnamed protein product [Phytomonas sp. EM1]|nr:unnamed protein product [Phytomonas sp. EM1]|eukprot:CCW59727.1 unnamed protein product [Phytomonas sp. isolate EM1]